MRLHCWHWYWSLDQALIEFTSPSLLRNKYLCENVFLWFGLFIQFSLEFIWFDSWENEQKASSLCSWLGIKKNLFVRNTSFCRLACSWTIFILDIEVVIFFLTRDQPDAENLGPKLHTGGGFYGPWFFIIWKNSHQDLSNEGSKFILSSLEVVHWVAQT